MTREIDIFTRQIIDTSVGTFIKKSTNIGVVTYKGRTDVTVEELSDFLNQIYQLMQDKPFYLINDLRQHYGSFSNEVWRFLGSDKKFNSTILRSIVISSSLGMRIQLNFFIKLIKPKFKVTHVKSEKEAYNLIDKLESAT